MPDPTPEDIRRQILALAEKISRGQGGPGDAERLAELVLVLDRMTRPAGEP